ncbi:putative 16S rRNA (guanine(966)-N(2))-methyltransferase [Candidatus Nitrotoga sp. M5]|nr:putative 16S rRNA (guanine(966)-N(2))-methyltransferase [Candidatus Nitrotoga sp. M5]
MRETLFNWLGQNLNGMRCLDLFAGSGALGFEAMSRGAAEVVMVERNRTIIRALQKTIIKLDCSNVLLRCEDGLEFAHQKNGLFDVIFLDPPFQSDYLQKLLPLLTDKLTQDGLVFVESGQIFEPDQTWQVVRHAKSSTVHYQLLRCESALKHD